MLKLTYSEIQSYVARATLPPTIPMASSYREALECPVCLESRPYSMLAHTECGRLICGSCIIALLDANHHCPICRGRLRANIWDDSSEPMIRKPSPIEQKFIENIQYSCEACSTSLNRAEALMHHQTCIASSRHQPPPYIPPRGVNPIERTELVSNAISDAADWKSYIPIILHYNGKQICTKIFGKNKTASHVKIALAKQIGIPAESFKLYKFSHREIRETIRVADLVDSPGSIYLSAFSDKTGLSTNAANILLEDVGPPHQIDVPEHLRQIRIAPRTYESLSLREQFEGPDPEFY